MTRDETIEAIKVMQAWVDGKAIEVNVFGVWGLVDPYAGSINWAWGHGVKYRIKSEPLVTYVTVWDDRDDPFGGAYASRVHAEKSAGGVAKVVRFAESPE